MMTRNQLPKFVVEHPVTTAIILTVAWHAVLFLIAAVLPPLSFDWFPELGASIINAILFALTVWLILVWRFARESGIGRPRPERAWWLVAPLLVISVSYGFPRLEGTPAQFVSTAVLCVFVGASEETLSRGLIQGILRPIGPYRTAILVGILFGLGHALSGLWFNRPIDDVAWQVLSTAIFGFCLAAVRFHLTTIWPLVLVHAADDFFMLRSPGAAPWWMEIVTFPFYIGFGILLIRVWKRQESTRERTGLPHRTQG
ncbi:lysostaphin resistance A-like protein [Micromonospora sp. DT81.3]|uniref:CPBP family intramembrane glutamic endopeptidase n=1 Tax=Micromonospora sp. DT81.3 TaxID=3416523 RepID=UPI003CED4CA6